ncbi:Uma2 family endonuclease [Streptomyces olivoreticuli]|uniref:Uma2 family endonuclease n=1 Tax=Streptomyces olivoreticuli TaxID=68246 RepID=UPI000E2731D3|nr:Uma2 family endonuclease [Streptomyces olivoreticuli]
MPIRPEYVEGTVLVPQPPDHRHTTVVCELHRRLRMTGCRWMGTGAGFRIGLPVEGTYALVIPDFYVLHRKPTEADEAHRKEHGGWHPIALVDLVGEVTNTSPELDTGPKYRSYASAGVPVYVIVHCQTSRVYVHSEPVSDVDNPALSHYRTTTTTALGGKVRLPDPYPVLDTAFLLES